MTLWNVFSQVKIAEYENESHGHTSSGTSMNISKSLEVFEIGEITESRLRCECNRGLAVLYCTIFPGWDNLIAFKLEMMVFI